MGKHTTSKMCPLTSKTCSPRLLPSRPQRVFGIQLGLLGLPTLAIPILPIMRSTMPCRSLLIMVIPRIILILGGDIRRIVHNLALVPRHLHVVVATSESIIPSPGRLRLESHPVFPFLSLCANQKKTRTSHPTTQGQPIHFSTPVSRSLSCASLSLPEPSCAVAADRYANKGIFKVARRTLRRVAESSCAAPCRSWPAPNTLPPPELAVSSRLARVVQTGLLCICMCACFVRASHVRLQLSVS